MGRTNNGKNIELGLMGMLIILAEMLWIVIKV